MAYIAPPLRDALKTGLRRYAEGVLAEHDGVLEQAHVPGPESRNQPAVDRMRAGVRVAYWHGGIYEVHSQRCDGELAVRFSREVARFGSALPSWFVRTAFTFVRTDGDVGDLRVWVPWVANYWGRLMSLMPDAVTPPVEYLTELALPYLRTAADFEYRDATDAAARYYGEAAVKNARREGAGAAPRPVPPYERPDISSWQKPDLVGRHLTLLLAEGDCVAVNQARKEVDVRARKGDDVPYPMTAGHHAKGLNCAGWRACRRRWTTWRCRGGCKWLIPPCCRIITTARWGTTGAASGTCTWWSACSSPLSRCWRTSPAGAFTASLSP